MVLPRNPNQLNAEGGEKNYGRQGNRIHTNISFRTHKLNILCRLMLDFIYPLFQTATDCAACGTGCW